MPGGRGNFVVKVAAGVLAAGGATAIAMVVAARIEVAQLLPTSAESLAPATTTIPVADLDFVPLPPLPEASLRQPPVVSTTIPEVVEPLSLPSSDPVALDIPAIGVQSTLLHLGLTAEHRLEVPAPGADYNKAAWYKHSATPGSLGPAILLGHVDSAAEGPSVFYRLGDLQPQDRVLVTRADGQVAVFRVDGIGQYPKDDFPTALVYGETDHAALRLITCGGVFDRGTGHYLDNIVVFATLVGVQGDADASSEPSPAQARISGP